MLPLHQYCIIGFKETENSLAVLQAFDLSLIYKFYAKIQIIISIFFIFFLIGTHLRLLLFVLGSFCLDGFPVPEQEVEVVNDISDC